MRDWFDDEEGPDPEYGPDTSNPLPVNMPSKDELVWRDAQRRKIERERQVSSDFNRHMIDLFNQRGRK